MKRRSFLSIIGALFTPTLPAVAARSPELAKFPRTLIRSEYVTWDRGIENRIVNPPMIVDIDAPECFDYLDLQPGRIVYLSPGMHPVAMHVAHK